MADDDEDIAWQVKEVLNSPAIKARREVMKKLLAKQEGGGAGVRRQYVLGFPKVTIAPGERKRMEQQTALPFYIERIVIPRASIGDPPWWRLQCFLSALWTNFLFCIPILINLLKHGEQTWRPFYSRPPDGRFLVNIEVGGMSQFMPGGEGVPVDVFDPNGIGLALQLETVTPGKPITLIVENRSKRETDFVCGIVGTCDQT